MKRITTNDPETRLADVVAENLEHLKMLLTEAFSAGEVDFEVMKQLLGDAVDERKEKYGFNWHASTEPGKSVSTFEDSIRERQVLTGPLFIEPMQMKTVRTNGSDGLECGAHRPASEVFPPDSRRLLDQGESRGYRGTDLLERRETHQLPGRLMAMKQSRLYSSLGQSCNELSDGMEDCP